MRCETRVGGTLLVLALVTQVLIGPAVSAQDRRSASSMRVLQQWEARLKRIDGLLVAGEPRNAYRQATALTEDMANLIVEGEGAAQMLGVATVLKAIAAVQLERRDEGVWHWLVAQQMFPEVAQYQMSAYGDAGPFLKSHQPRNVKEPSEDVFVIGKDVLRPKKLKDPKPTIPLAKRGGEPVAVIVQAVIGEDGRPRDPLVLHSAGEITLVCATLEKLRLWEFEPATRDGIPVPVFYNLTVMFRPQR